MALENNESIVGMLQQQEGGSLTSDVLGSAAKSIQRLASSVQSGKGRGRLERLAKRITELLMKIGECTNAVQDAHLDDNPSSSVLDLEKTIVWALKAGKTGEDFMRWYSSVGSFKKALNKMRMHKKYDDALRHIVVATKNVETQFSKIRSIRPGFSRIYHRKTVFLLPPIAERPMEEEHGDTRRDGWARYWTHSHSTSRLLRRSGYYKREKPLEFAGHPSAKKSSRDTARDVIQENIDAKRGSKSERSLHSDTARAKSDRFRAGLNGIFASSMTQTSAEPNEDAKNRVRLANAAALFPPDLSQRLVKAASTSYAEEIVGGSLGREAQNERGVKSELDNKGRIAVASEDLPRSRQRRQSLPERPTQLARTELAANLLEQLPTAADDFMVGKFRDLAVRQDPTSAAAAGGGDHDSPAFRQSPSSMAKDANKPQENNFAEAGKPGAPWDPYDEIDVERPDFWEVYTSMSLSQNTMQTEMAALQARSVPHLSARVNRPRTHSSDSEHNMSPRESGDSLTISLSRRKSLSALLGDLYPNDEDVGQALVDEMRRLHDNVLPHGNN